MALRIADLADARVAIWGFGREGRAALEVLRRCFPRKPVAIFCSEAEASSVNKGAPSAPGRRSPEGLDEDPIPRQPPPSPPTPLPTGDGSTCAQHEVITTPPDVAALEQFDIVIKSPGISPYKLPAAAALRAGVHFTSGSALWFAEHPHANTICVTGTKGKSTVTALIAHLLRASGRCVALAGNIGLPLLELMTATSYPPAQARQEESASRGGRSLDLTGAGPDWWVIELSSFQTHDFGGAPTVAVINNLYEEHLDWHGTRERYVADKLLIGANAKHLVVNAQDALLQATESHRSRSVFGTDAGWHVADEAVCRGGAEVLSLRSVPLPGRHNAQNVCAALAAIEAAGFDAVALAHHVATFTPLPHRLQNLGSRNGIDYVNDSIATTPHATIEALRSVGERAAIVLVGGFDRGLDWQPFVDHVAAHPPTAIIAMGANGAAIAAALNALAPAHFTLRETTSLAAAMAQAHSLAAPGATILMSPGAPSFDAFRDYAERGREFARLAGFDPSAIAQVEGLGIA